MYRPLTSNAMRTGSLGYIVLGRSAVDFGHELIEIPYNSFKLKQKRREGDSNPRHGFCPCNCLAGSPVRPLQHLSVVERCRASQGRNLSIIGKMDGNGHKEA